MRAKILMLAGIAMLAGPVSASLQVPYLQPGVYGASFSCNGAPPVLVTFYVLSDLEDPGYKFDDSKYQRVRVSAGDSQFTGKAFLNGMGQLRISSTYWERTSSKGFNSYPDTYDFSGAFEDLRGTASMPRQVRVAGGGTEWRSDACPMVPDPTAARNAKPLADMSYAATPEVVAVDHSTHRTGVPTEYVAFTPTASNADAMAKAISATIADDSQSWLLNRLKPGSVSDFHYFSSASDPSYIYAWASFVYTAADGWNSGGFAAVRFRDGLVDCIQYHDKRSCTRPRMSASAQIASLGGGRPSLPPISIPERCFKQETRYETRTRETVTYADPMGDVDTKTEYYSVPVTVTVFQCATQDYQLDCIAEGTDRLTEWAIGTGTTKLHQLSFRKGETTEILPGDVANYNKRINAKTCVRTQ